MNITWLGHSGFRIEIGGTVLLLDPWLDGNPAFPAGRRSDAVQGATHILLTHGHGDHAGDVVALAQELKIPVACIHELAQLLAARGVETIGFNKGGTIKLDGVEVTMVHALHSSSFEMGDGPAVYAGEAAGFMIAGEDHVIYASGDTEISADMALMAELHNPDIGILCAGGLYTMDMKRAAFAARKFFQFKVIIPSHFKTFPALEQSVDALRSGLGPHVRVIEPEVMVQIPI